MDSRLIPLILALGWLLVTLGIWGACGRPWWIWPLAVGAGLLVVGAIYGWAFWRTLMAGGGQTKDKYDPERRPESGT